MTAYFFIIRGSSMALLLVCGTSLSSPTWATSLAAYPISAETASKETPKNEMINAYVALCQAKPIKQNECDKIKKNAVDLLKEDLHTLGSSANPTYLPTIFRIFKSHEPELRIAAADAVGMIGPPESNIEQLAALANDPVPDVRKAASQMLQHGKGDTLVLLARRTGITLRTGRIPEMPPDPQKISLPVAPDSTYLFFASDVEQGRLTYTTRKTMKDILAFFKQKAKKDPLDLAAFTHMYEKALADEQQAREQIQQEASAKMFSQEPPTDQTKMDTYLKQLEQAQIALAAQNQFMLDELYPPEFFGSPKVFVLEDRKIGRRNYPTKYVVLYEDMALKRPGFRLCWLTVSQQAIKTTQMTSMMGEAIEKDPPREEDMAPAIKGKSEKERNKFKQEQLDMEKQLGL
ncbi:MAG: HEAT repeat domain-containing protein [Nitrospirales bacterium]